MLTALYDAIRKDAKPEQMTINNRSYTTSPLYPVNEPLPAEMQARTLSALVDYLKTNIDAINIKNLICHVESPTEVYLASALGGEFLDRAVYLRLKADVPKHNFDAFIDSERFIIWLQSCFVDGVSESGRHLVLEYAGNVKNEEITTFGDDGITQGVTIKSGVASVKRAALPNPVVLRPYRTFIEVVQPASAFVFRAKKSESMHKDSVNPDFALIEADGGAWKIEAMQAIKAYFNEHLPDLLVIA